MADQLQSCLLNLLDKWMYHLLNNRKGVDVMYTNFEKAFNKVPHKHLLFKLKNTVYVIL